MKPGYKERFLRNFGIMDEAGLRKIQSTSVAIGGLGLGGSIFLNFVRMGFQNFHISDPDIYERTNINRQRMAKESTVGKRKDEALLAEAYDINPDIHVRTFPEGINKENVSRFLDGMDWVIDVVDVFALDEKLALNEEAARRGIPVASCGALGFSAAVIVFDKTTPTFKTLTGMDPSLPYETNIQRFLQFLCPQIPEYMREQMDKAMNRAGHIPFVVPGVEISAAFAVSQVAMQILDIGQQIRAPQGIYINPTGQKIEIFEANHKAREIKPAVKKAA